MMDINVEESTVEIEPWVDYMELEVGPILKYMQYPSFDSDDENIQEESTDDFFEGELGTHSDENLVNESTDNFIKEELDTYTYNGEQLRPDSTDYLVEKDMNVEDMHGHFDLDAYDDTGVDENIQHSSNNDHLEEYVNVDDQHGDLDLDDDYGTDTNMLDEKLDNFYEDNQTDSSTGVVIEKLENEENVKDAFQDINTEPLNRKAETLDNSNENEIEDEKYDVILEQKLQLDTASEISDETKIKYATDDLDQTDNVSLEPDSNDPELEGEGFDILPETEVTAKKLKGKDVDSLDRKNSASKKEWDNALLDSQDRSSASFDSELNENAGDKLYHRADGDFDVTEIFSGREELEMVEEKVGRQFCAKDGEGEIKGSILDEDDDTSEPSETGYSEASTKTASEDRSESIEDTNGRKITVTVDDANKSDSVFLHDASHKKAMTGERNNVAGKKQKDLYLDQSRHVRNDREEQFRHVKNDKEEQFRHMKNDRETFRQDRTKESYRERYTDDNEAIQQRTQIEKSKVEDPFAGHRPVTMRNQIKSSDKQDAAYYVRKGESIDLAESARYSMYKRKNIIKTPEKIRNSREKQLSFDTDTKFENEYNGQINRYDKSSHQSVDKKYYIPKESMQRYDMQPDIQGKRQIENKEHYRTKEHYQPTKVKSLPANITELDNGEIKYSDTRSYEKPYAHVAGRFNYSNRPPRSQDALANRQHKNVRISRIPGQKKDGPLSLQDSYGAGMEPNDTSQSGHRVFSSASNHFSESSSSIANQVKGISQSPSKQSNIVRQQSVQSDINGEQREEGIKFERLKNLQEDDLFAKVKEIVGHLEKLEDYHRGDGMRVQKMLGDMYWDYTPLREMVGDCMGDCGYAVVSMKMLKTLNGIGIFKNDDVWFPTYYTYNTMWNFTDASNRLAQALADNDAVRLLTLNCGHKPYINAIHSKNVYYVMKASLSILHNIARNSGMKHLFDENKTSETIMPFLESEDEMLKILATLTIANIVDEEENKTLITDTGTISCIVSWMEKALNLARRRYKGFTPQELTEGLNRLAVNDSNKMKIIEEGALPLFLKMLQHDDVREQSSAARIIWTLSFDKDVRQKINEFPELVPILEKLTESTNKSLQTNTTGALWVIRGDNDVSKESRPKSAKSKSHVFLSYSWSDKETVLMMRDRLRAEGYAIWIDVEKMGGSTLEGMAAAVENSAVVLVCMSEKYKQSPNCRTEAEYTFQLRKDYIPIMMQKKYRPDGWLGIILGAKLYFDFSGKYPFDKTLQGLLKELRGRGKVTPGHSPGDDQTDTTGTITHSHSLSSHASITGTPTHQIHSNSPVLNMGQEELIKWLRNIKLTECIPAFLEFDGKLLMQLKVMREEAPEFFYQCLEKRLNMSLIEILKFTRALEELH